MANNENDTERDCALRSGILAIRGSMHEKFVVYPFVKEDAIYNQQQLAFLAAQAGLRQCYYHISRQPLSLLQLAVARVLHAFTVSWVRFNRFWRERR